LVLPKVIDVISESDHQIVKVATKAKTPRPGALADALDVGAGRIEMAGQKRLSLLPIDVRPLSVAHC
jgi:hypothetical protein